MYRGLPYGYRSYYVASYGIPYTTAPSLPVARSFEVTVSVWRTYHKRCKTEHLRAGQKEGEATPRGTHQILREKTWASSPPF